MKIAAFMVGLVAFLVTGCSSIPGLPKDNGGLIGAVQTVDDSLAAKSGVPQAVVDKVREALGIVDTRKLPGRDRVLPVGWTWKQDILDKDGKPIDISSLRRGPPYVVPAGSSPDTSVSASDLFPGEASTNDPTDLLVGAIKFLQEHPDLLQPAVPK